MRNAKGQWVPGTSGNPGGKVAGDRSAKYWEITQSTCSFKDWKAIVVKAVEDAKKGDRYARAWLADRLMGKDPLTLGIMGSLGLDVDEAFEKALEKAYGSQ